MTIEGTIVNMILVNKFKKLCNRLNDLVARVNETEAVTDSDMVELSNIYDDIKKIEKVNKVTGWFGFIQVNKETIADALDVIEGNMAIGKGNLKNASEQRPIGF